MTPYKPAAAITSATPAKASNSVAVSRSVVIESDSAAFMAREPGIRRAIHDLVALYQGSFSAEHGIGRLKREELQRYDSPARLAAMRAIKQALDPNNILNPGKLL